jgi:uncharacterized repeat protein (TIGR01451 family)
LVLIITSLGTVTSATSVTGTPNTSPKPSTLAFESGDEYIRTYAADCATPQTVFYLGDTVCAEAGNFPLDWSNFPFRRFQWGTPSGQVADQSGIKYDPQFDKFVIPTTGAFAKVGRWTLRAINFRAIGNAGTSFFVRDARMAWADLQILKSGPFAVLPGDRVEYTVWATNYGPDTAKEIEIIDEVPTNMVFVGAQLLSRTDISCKTPTRGETGRTVCYARGLEIGEQVGLKFYYQVSYEVREGDTSTSTAQISSYTDELDKVSNFATTEITVTREECETCGGEEEGR